MLWVTSCSVLKRTRYNSPGSRFMRSTRLTGVPPRAATGVAVTGRGVRVGAGVAVSEGVAVGVRVGVVVGRGVWVGVGVAVGSGVGSPPQPVRAGSTSRPNRATEVRFTDLPPFIGGPDRAARLTASRPIQYGTVQCWFHPTSWANRRSRQLAPHKADLLS